MRIVVFSVLLAMANAPAYGQEPDTFVSQQSDTPISDTVARINFSEVAPMGFYLAGAQSSANSTSSDAGVSRWMIGGIIAANTLDLVSTELVLRDFACRKCHEANPLMRPFVGSPIAMVAVKGGATAFSIWTVNKLHKDGYTKATKVVGVICIFLPTIVSVANLAGR